MAALLFLCDFLIPYFEESHYLCNVKEKDNIGVKHNPENKDRSRFLAYLGLCFAPVCFQIIHLRYILML